MPRSLGKARGRNHKVVLWPRKGPRMRRDMDLIRLILLDVEGEEKPDLSGYTQEQITYHKYLLIDADLAEGNPVKRRTPDHALLRADIY
ncbi:MAG: DUF2513 domain-containing protein, partial [Spirochaetia bacterium]|nr:DUF2513 domain-containing protein [Spirochaetia bacterium]